MTNSDLSAAGAVFFPFLRALAHDMAAPLTSALGYTQLNLEAPGSQEEILEDLRQIEESAQALRLQVSMLSRLSRYRPEEQTCSVDRLLEDVRVLTRSLSQSAGVSISWREEPEATEGQVRGNPWLLRATVLAFLGPLCKQSAPEVCAARLGGSMVLEFTTPEGRSDAWEDWGSPAEAERLAQLQELGLEKGEQKWRLSLELVEPS